MHETFSDGYLGKYGDFLEEALRGLFRDGVLGGGSDMDSWQALLLLRLILVLFERSSPASDVLRLGRNPSVSLSKSSGGRTGLNTGLDSALESGLVAALDGSFG